MGAFLFTIYLIGLPIVLIGTIKYIWRETSFWDWEEYWQLFLVTIFWPIALSVWGVGRFFVWLVETLKPKPRW